MTWTWSEDLGLLATAFHLSIPLSPNNNGAWDRTFTAFSSSWDCIRSGDVNGRCSSLVCVGDIQEEDDGAEG